MADTLLHKTFISSDAVAQVMNNVSVIIEKASLSDIRTGTAGRDTVKGPVQRTSVQNMIEGENPAMFNRVLQLTKVEHSLVSIQERKVRREKRRLRCP